VAVPSGWFSRARATTIPSRLTERRNQSLVDSKMLFEEAIMCALTLMLAIGTATGLALALSVLPTVSNLSPGTETKRSLS
jgi:hypothetical protein